MKRSKRFSISVILIALLALPCVSYADTHIKGRVSENEAMRIILGGFMDSSNGSDSSLADIGSYDVWLHADGKTWQNGIKPGSSVSVNFDVPLGISSQYHSSVKNVSAVFLDKPSDIYNQKYFPYGVTNAIISNCKYQGNGKVSFTYKTTLTDNSGLGGFDITRSDQAELVQGKRFYLPVKISYEIEGKGSSGIITWTLGNPDSFEIDMTIFD